MRQDDDARTSGAPFSDARMCRGLASPGVSDFDDDVDCLQGFGQLSFGFGNVAGVPVDSRAFVTGFEQFGFVVVGCGGEGSCGC